MPLVLQQVVLADWSWLTGPSLLVLADWSSLTGPGVVVLQVVLVRGGLSGGGKRLPMSIFSSLAAPAGKDHAQASPLTGATGGYVDQYPSIVLVPLNPSIVLAPSYPST